MTLYDLTNTFLEGEAADQPKAQRGHSKEKRGDCPLLTLGLVLDGSGFVRRSKVFAGNVKEPESLPDMLKALNAPPGARVVMDRGIATEDRVKWLREHGYRYIVVSRERRRRFDAEAAVPHATRSGATVHLHKVDDPDGGEVRLYCYSEDRAKKERGIAERFARRFEQDLKALHEGLSRPGTQKRIDLIWQRIGRIREKSRGAGQHYEVKVDLNETGQRAVAVHFTRQPVDGTLATHPGVYCLRSNETDWSEARLWRTYTLLTDLEAVFRSLKSELGLRPIYHRKPLPRRGPSVHYRHRLPARAGHPQDAGRARRRRAQLRKLDDATPRARRPPARHRHLQARRRAHPARAQGHRGRTQPTGHPRRLGHPQGRRWRYLQDDRLNPNPIRARVCSALRAISTA